MHTQSNLLLSLINVVMTDTLRTCTHHLPTLRRATCRVWWAFKAKINGATNLAHDGINRHKCVFNEKIYRGQMTASPRSIPNRRRCDYRRHCPWIGSSRLIPMDLFKGLYMLGGQKFFHQINKVSRQWIRVDKWLPRTGSWQTHWYHYCRLRGTVGKYS